LIQSLPYGARGYSEDGANCEAITLINFHTAPEGTPEDGAIER